MRVAEIILQILMPIIAALIGWLVHKVARWVTGKTKVEIPQRQLDLIDEWARKGIAYAEEKARGWAKMHAAKMPPHEKLDAATNFVMDFIIKRGWHDWSREAVSRYIEAKLNIERNAPAVISASATVSTPTTVDQPLPSPLPPPALPPPPPPGLR